MKNFVQPGDNLEVTAPDATESGDLVLAGSIFGVATTDAKDGAAVVLSTRGVYRLPKIPADVVTQGAKLYRVAAAGSNQGKLTVTAAGNVLIGVAAKAAAATVALVECRLNGSF